MAGWAGQGSGGLRVRGYRARGRMSAGAAQSSRRCRAAGDGTQLSCGRGGGREGWVPEFRVQGSRNGVSCKGAGACGCCIMRPLLLSTLPRSNSSVAGMGRGWGSEVPKVQVRGLKVHAHLSALHPTPGLLVLQTPPHCFHTSTLQARLCTRPVCGPSLALLTPLLKPSRIPTRFPHLELAGKDVHQASLIVFIGVCDMEREEGGQLKPLH